MSTVFRRCFNSTPARDAHRTWEAIVELLTRGRDGVDRDELLTVSGIAASIIGDQAPLKAPIVVTCDGPRTRIYCLYDDDAIEGSDANEDPLGFDPLKGDWSISLPCLADDLGWVGPALSAQTARVTARDASEGITVLEEASGSAGSDLVFDQQGFRGS